MCRDRKGHLLRFCVDQTHSKSIFGLMVTNRKGSKRNASESNRECALDSAKEDKDESTPHCVISVCENRAHEIGIAEIDLNRLHTFELAQFSDSSSYSLISSHILQYIHSSFHILDANTKWFSFPTVRKTLIFTKHWSQPSPTYQTVNFCQ